MENFIVALNVVLPLFILISLGYVLKRIGLISDCALKELNGLVFKIFLPTLLFNNMYEADLSKNVELTTIVYAVCCILVLFAVLCIFIPHFVKNRSVAATMIQGMYRSNFALFGIAITESMYGEGNAGVTGILVAIIVPLFNALAVILFEVNKGGSVNIRKISKGIVTNPLIIGTVLGFLCKMFQITLPDVIQKSLSTLGGLATPLALLVLGGTFTFGKLVENRKPLFAVVAARLVIIPAIFIALSILLGYRGKELFSLYIMFGSPTAVASFAMAGGMGGDGELAGQIVVVTTVISLFSCIAFIYVMKSMGVI